MLERVRKVVEAIFGFPAVFEMLIVLAAAVWACVTLASLVFEKKYDEAATAYILVATIGGIIGFCIWICRDAPRSSQRLAKHLPKAIDSRLDEVADDADNQDTPD